MSSEAPPARTFAFPQLDGPPTVAELGDALAAARREADQLREQAQAEGYAVGHAAGLADAAQAAASALAALAAAAHELTAARERLTAEIEHDALALAFGLAEQVLAGALDVQPERVLDVARHALRHLNERRQVTLVVNPDDLGLLRAAAADLQAELGGIEHLSVQADRRVVRGGAIARNESGEIDSGITVQLARARELVAEALAEELPDGEVLVQAVTSSELTSPADGAAS